MICSLASNKTQISLQEESPQAVVVKKHSHSVAGFSIWLKK